MLVHGGYVKLEGPVYEAYMAVSGGFSFHDTASAYSFGWMYDGYMLRVELCRGSVAVIEEGGEGALLVKVYAERGQRCWESELDGLEERLGAWEELDDYLSMARGDPLVGGLAEAMPGLRMRRSSIWYALLVAVCQQNASFRQGWGMLYKLHLLASRRLAAPGPGPYLETPSPSAVSEEVLRSAGLGYRAYAVAEAARRGAAELGCDEAEELLEIRGIGPYTVSLVKLLACRDYASLPLDKWLKRLAAEAYSVSEAAAEAELRRRFGGYAGLAALHTTIAFDAEPIRRALKRLREGKNRPGLRDPSPLTLWRHTPPQP